MDRRAALGRLTAAAAAGAFPADLSRLGRALHARLSESPGRRVLTVDQNATVVALTDRILPATDTPGAKAAGVNEFIDLLMAEWFEAAERDQFTAGIAMIDQRSSEAFGKRFIDAAPEQQVTLLTTLDDEAARWKASPAATRGPEPFYRQIKWLTLFGYYTSQVGAEQEDHYLIVPGRYEPCAPLPLAKPPE